MRTASSGVVLESIELRVLLSGGGVAFSGTGTAALAADPQFEIRDVAVQADGKLLVAGVRFLPFTPAFQIQVFRLNADASIDNGFGSSGAATFQFAAGEPNAQVDQVAVDKDGRILVAGSVTTAGGDTDATVARLTSNGTLDSSFGTSGVQTYAIAGNDEFHALVPQSDGTILLGGQSGGDILVARLTSTGAFDPAFNGGAALKENAGGTDSLSDLVPLTGGQVLAIGNTVGASSDYVAFRLTAGGAIDKTYGQNGFVSLSGFDPVRGFRQSDGTVLVAGTDTTVANPTEPQLVRFTAGGKIDPIGGKSRVDVQTSFLSVTTVQDVVQQPDGFLVFLGTTKLNEFSTDAYVLRTSAQVRPTWTLADGAPTSSTPEAQEAAHGLALGSGGIIYAGASNGGLVSDTVIKFIGKDLAQGAQPFGTLSSNGTLTIPGTSGADVFNLMRSPSLQDILVRRSGQSAYFVASKVKRVIVNAGDGNDTVQFDQFDQMLTVPVSVNGGAGDDALLGSPKSDSLNGGPGNDTIHGYGGNDTIFGSPGADEVFGDGGNDTADYSAYTPGVRLTLDNKPNDGPSGDAVANIHSDIENLIGGHGNDYLQGDPFANKLVGNAGNDTLWGGEGNDTLEGDAGHDQLFGQGGDDTLLGKDGAKDTLDGGDGIDSAQRDKNASVKDLVLNVESVS